MDVCNENVIEWQTGQSVATVTASQKRHVNRLHKLSEDYPDECKILAVNTDGSLVAHVPLAWVRISRPRQVELTEEQKRERRERLAMSRTSS